jgi:hypothetical protein
MITDLIRLKIQPTTVIPKPEAKGEFTVKGWGKRRNQVALVYRIPNHNFPSHPYEKGITEHEFETAYKQIMQSGTLTRQWFNSNLASCAKEGGCNFTTIGGIFELLGVARRSERGAYTRST